MKELQRLKITCSEPKMEQLSNNLQCYNESAESFDRKIGSLTNYDEAYIFFSSNLNGTELLDAACGPANISRFILRNWKIYKKESLSENLKITLMDLSQEMLKLAKKYIPEATVLCHSITNFNAGLFDGIINGFGLPYLCLEEGLTHFKTVYNSLKTNGLYYLSFMNASDEKRNKNPTFTQNEHPSFNPRATITVTYWNQNFVENELKKTGFTLLKKWNLDYLEPDGSITTDVVLILKK